MRFIGEVVVGWALVVLVLLVTALVGVGIGLILYALLNVGVWFFQWAGSLSLPIQGILVFIAVTLPFGFVYAIGAEQNRENEARLQQKRDAATKARANHGG